MSQALKKLQQKLSFDDHHIDTQTPFVFKAPEHFINQVNLADASDPLLKQILPTIEERTPHNQFKDDPVADLANNPVPGLIHKYHGRVLLIASAKCDIHCRYCFRRHFPYADQATPKHWAQALQYISETPSVHEVILSGGDPMSLSESTLLKRIQEIESIDHVKTLRIHSRTPIVAPEKAPQNEFLEWAMNSRLNKVLVVHSNHANEFTAKSAELLQLYRHAGITLLNQAVLLKGVNDNIAALADLSHKMFSQGVLPYYLNLLDRVAGAAHFEVEETFALKLHKELRNSLPGYLVPKLVRDITGQGSKTSLI